MFFPIRKKGPVLQEFIEAFRRSLPLQLIEVDGHVTIANLKSAYEGRKHIDDPVLLEKSANHVHLSLEFSSLLWLDEVDWSFADASLMAQVYVAVLERRLRMEFPEREFCVKCENCGVNEEDFDLVVYWFEIRSES